MDEPDCVIVQDPTILREVDVKSGLKDAGIILVNSDKYPRELQLSGTSYQVFTIFADELARGILGRPIINTALFRCFCRHNQRVNASSRA